MRMAKSKKVYNEYNKGVWWESLSTNFLIINYGLFQWPLFNIYLFFYKKSAI